MALVEHKNRYNDYLKELKDYNEQFEKYGLATNKEKPLSPRISEYIGKCILQIANRLCLSPNFYSYSYRGEMVSDAIEDAILRINSFDPAKSTNAFSYFTQICYYACVRRIKKEQNQKAIKSEIIINSGVLDDLSAQQGSDDDTYTNSYFNFLVENIDQPKEKLQKKFKRTTLAYQKKQKEKELLLGKDVEPVEVEVLEVKKRQKRINKIHKKELEETDLKARKFEENVLGFEDVEDEEEFSVPSHEE